MSYDIQLALSAGFLSLIAERDMVATIQAIKEHKEFYSYQALQTVDAHGLLPNFHHKCL